MNIVVFRVLMAALSLLGIDLVSYGFAFGFAIFIALSASIILLFWGYYRLVSRRRRPVQKWHWEQFGSHMYRVLEVA